MCSMPLAGLAAAFWFLFRVSWLDVLGLCPVAPSSFLFLDERADRLVGGRWEPLPFLRVCGGWPFSLRLLDAVCGCSFCVVFSSFSTFCQYLSSST